MEPKAQTPDFSIVVPNWNGEPFLLRGIGSLFLSARRAKRPFELIVVDDDSQDGGPDLVEREFPTARLVRRPRNGGFAQTSNQGARLARGEIVIFANNDLIVREEFVPRLLEAMEGDSVFAVSAMTLDWNRGEPNHLEMHAVWREGLIAQSHSKPARRVETVFAQGGACAVRRSEFLALGGFCDLFFPGYWEDYDLSYRACKQGRKSLYEPLAVANHLGQASLAARYGREAVEITRRRNQILFTWLNLSDRRLWLRHALEFPAAVGMDLIRGGGSPLAKGLARALPMLPRVLAERKRRRRRRGNSRRVSDSEILK